MGFNGHWFIDWNVIAILIVLAIAIMNIILLIVVVFVRNVYLAGGILYAVPFLTGIMFFWLGQFFIEALGAAFLLSVFFGTVVLIYYTCVSGIKYTTDLLAGECI